MSSRIKTNSFDLAVYSRGESTSSKLALVLPGKLDTKDYPHMRSHVDHLAAKGYLAVSFDPAGTWESAGEIELYNTTNYLKAVNELIAYFGNRPTFVIGHSRGGHIALLAGTQNPNVTHYGAIMSYYSLNRGYPDRDWQQAGYKLSEREIPGTNGTQKKSFKLPYSFLEDQIQYDVSEALTKSTKPKMFVCADRDSLVPPEIIQAAYDMAAEPKFLYHLDSNHDYRRSAEHISQVESFMDDFLMHV